jgi:enamine deaminase RidA (YjgF/YER057c/UK114 family)
MKEAFRLSYVGYRELDSTVAAGETLLGTAAFGSAPPPGDALARASGVWIDMPALHGAGVCEVWQSAQPVERMERAGVRGGCNEHVLFGCLQLAEDAGIEAAARLAYERVFETIDALGYPYLLRAWNYLSAINGDADGIERYRRFNVGRHAAFAAHGRALGIDMPAACALGSRGGPLTVYFVAGIAQGRALENPRQVSAYHYPERYGPRSPTFSRAMAMQVNGQRCVAISGTASIVGHETRHAGDAAAQVDETLANIRVLLREGGYDVVPSPAAGDGLLLKAYLREPADLPIVERALARTFGRADTVYLQADICRADLLVEIEGLYTPPA